METGRCSSTYAAKATVHQYNYIVNGVTEISPQEYLYNRSPAIETISSLRCIDYTHVSKETRQKIFPTAFKAELLGYPSDTRDCMTMRLDTRRSFNFTSFYSDEESFFRN